MLRPEPLSNDSPHLAWLFNDMLSHIPLNINNERGAITQWLLIFDRWSIPEITRMLNELIEARRR